MRVKIPGASVGFGEVKKPKRREYAAVGFGETHPNSVEAHHARIQERKAAQTIQAWRDQNPEPQPQPWYAVALRRFVQFLSYRRYRTDSVD